MHVLDVFELVSSSVVFLLKKTWRDGSDSLVDVLLAWFEVWTI
jgi:hypothetical protein